MMRRRDIFALFGLFRFLSAYHSFSALRGASAKRIGLDRHFYFHDTYKYYLRLYFSS